MCRLFVHVNAAETWLPCMMSHFWATLACVSSVLRQGAMHLKNYLCQWRPALASHAEAVPGNRLVCLALPRTSDLAQSSNTVHYCAGPARTTAIDRPACARGLAWHVNGSGVELQQSISPTCDDEQFLCCLDVTWLRAAIFRSADLPLLSCSITWFAMIQRKPQELLLG